MSQRPYKKHNVTRTDNGDGTFAEALDTGVDIYGTTILHESEVALSVSRHTDLSIGQILVLQEGQYRIVRMERVSHASRRIVRLERVKRPIRPAAANDAVTSLSYASMSENDYEALTEDQYNVLVEG